MKKRVEIKLKFSADLDAVPGWGYDPQDWVNYVNNALSRQSHYNTKVDIESVDVSTKETFQPKSTVLAKTNDQDSVVGTSLQGYLYTTYQNIVDKLGEPSHDGDGYKIDVEWVLRDQNGEPVTLYNWKDGPNYCGDEGTPVEKITMWHIGGRSSKAVDLIRGSFPGYYVKAGY